MAGRGDVRSEAPVCVVCVLGLRAHGRVLSGEGGGRVVVRAALGRRARVWREWA